MIRITITALKNLSETKKEEIRLLGIVGLIVRKEVEDLNPLFRATAREKGDPEKSWKFQFINEKAQDLLNRQKKKKKRKKEEKEKKGKEKKRKKKKERKK